MQLPAMERAMATGDHQVLAAMDEDAFDAVWDETFALGSRHLLDGVADVRRRERSRGSGRGR